MTLAEVSAGLVVAAALLIVTRMIVDILFGG